MIIVNISHDLIGLRLFWAALITSQRSVELCLAPDTGLAMKPSAFAVLLMLAPLLAGADWVRMGEDSQQITHYFDPSTIGKEGDLRTVRWLEEHRKQWMRICCKRLEVLALIQPWT